MKRLEPKMPNICAGSTSANDFIIAHAKDADAGMAFGVTAPGPQSGSCRHGYIDAFQLIYDAHKQRARLALFGRKTNLSEHPPALIEMLRRVVAGQFSPVEAVKVCHCVLQKTGIRPQRPLRQDMQLTANEMSYR